VNREDSRNRLKKGGETADEDAEDLITVPGGLPE